MFNEAKGIIHGVAPNFLQHLARKFDLNLRLESGKHGLLDESTGKWTNLNGKVKLFKKSN